MHHRRIIPCRQQPRETLHRASIILPTIPSVFRYPPASTAVSQEFPGPGSGLHRHAATEISAGTRLE
jgi:hypothetical protein